MAERWVHDRGNFDAHRYELRRSLPGTDAARPKRGRGPTLLPREVAFFAQAPTRMSKQMFWCPRWRVLAQHLAHLQVKRPLFFREFAARPSVLDRQCLALLYRRQQSMAVRLRVLPASVAKRLRRKAVVTGAAELGGGRSVVNCSASSEVEEAAEADRLGSPGCSVNGSDGARRSLGAMSCGAPEERACAQQEYRGSN